MATSDDRLAKSLGVEVPAGPLIEVVPEAAELLRRRVIGSDNPIHVATYATADVVRALVAAGFNPLYGESALVGAVESEDSEIVHTLVEGGVDVGEG